MKCKLSEKCEFGNLCKDATRHDSLTVLGCSSFKTKEPMTNEEWRRTCSAEEFAEWIASEINERVKLALHDSELNDGDVDADFYMEDSDDWKEWLKQPHSEVGK